MQDLPSILNESHEIEDKVMHEINKQKKGLAQYLRDFQN